MIPSGDEGPTCCNYSSVRTLVFNENEDQVARLGVALWPPVGSVIELGNPNRDAVVLEVRLSLPQTNHNDGGAVVYVFTDDNGVRGRPVPRNAVERFLEEGQH
ncbi:MAG TPA: hypothetical protein VK988_20580 [Acidimicrobiales bacterium]|nr:hypothetical protein [Acidimicrobiales bacterium]